MLQLQNRTVVDVLTEELLQWSATREEARGGIGKFPCMLNLDNKRESDGQLESSVALP
jgi:hypothetical protein